jgi:hypothetical protein
VYEEADDIFENEVRRTRKDFNSRSDQIMDRKYKSADRYDDEDDISEEDYDENLEEEPVID